MKKQLMRVFFLCSTVLFVNNLYAQVDSIKAEKLKGQLIDSVCSCVSKADVSNTKTVEDAQMLMMQCFMGNNMSLFGDYLAALGVDFSNMQATQNTLVRLSFELSYECPALMKIMQNISKDPNEMKKLQGQMNQIEKMFPNEIDSTKKNTL